MRVVSLVPSSTETLFSLGADIVACTAFCEQPQLVHVGGTKNPDIEAIVELAPDVVVLDREENRREDADALRAAGLNLFVSEVNSLVSAVAVVDELAALIGTVPPDLTLPEVPPLGVSVFVPIWRRPWMTISDDTYGGTLLAQLGCRLVPGISQNRYPHVNLDEVAELRPDVLAVPSEPYEFTDSHIAELQGVLDVSAPIRIDGQDLFWWGARTPDAITRLTNQISAALPSSPPSQ